LAHSRISMYRFDGPHCVHYEAELTWEWEHKRFTTCSEFCLKRTA